MWDALQRYKALDPEARKLFGRAVRLLPLITVSLRLRGFKKTKEALQRKLSRTQEAGARPESAGEAVQRTCRMVRAGARYAAMRPTCLEESLVLWYLLQNQNLMADLRIGVRL